MLPRPTFHRFLPNWLAFGSAVGVTAFVAMSTSILVSPPGPGEDDFPPLMVVFTSVGVYVAALAVGVVLAPFRRWFVGRRFSFMRPGYLALAALPLVWLAVPGISWPQKGYMVVACEVFMIAAAMVFVLVGRWFGAFDDTE